MGSWKDVMVNHTPALAFPELMPYLIDHSIAVLVIYIEGIYSPLPKNLFVYYTDSDLNLK